MKLPTLYHKTKTGKIIEWEVWTENDRIITRYGEEGGKKQTTSKRAEPKNVGKSNETTGAQQAEKEAEAMHKKRLDRKYSLTKEEAEKPVFLPMLANSFEDKKHKVKYPVDVQPKFDGNRCFAFWKGNKVVLMSREGLFFNIPHIQEEISQHLPKRFVLDGEIYIHGMPLQNINKLIKKHREGPEGSEQLKFYCYDGFTLSKTKEPWTWTRRLWELNLVLQHMKDPVIPVDVALANSEKEVRDLEKAWAEKGYEGAIVRLHDGVYELGHRSSNLLKVKTFVDDEFKIVGHTYGSGRAEKAVVWTCEQEEGKRFNVVPATTIEEREKMGKNPKKYYGKWLTVKYQKRTEDNMPFLPVGKGFRLKADLPKKKRK